MGLIIQKFGGSSVANLARMQQVAKIIKQTRDQGHQVVVVVSAMFGETDRLIQLSRSASQKVVLREYDALLTTGEQASAALMSLVLINNDCPARSYNAIQARIITDAAYSKATIHDIDTIPLKRDLISGVIPVVAGFQGVSPQGDLTTLGRGGSDLTAVMLAAALQADECQIFTDVDGVYTSDPRVVSEARRFDSISYEEMWLLSELGAKVLQNAAVKAADRYRVPLRVLSSFVEGPGTLVTGSPHAYPSLCFFSGIALDRHQARLTISGLPDQSEQANNLIEAMMRASINIDMIVKNINSTVGSLDISFTVSRDHYEQAFRISQQCSQAIHYSKVFGDTAIGKLSLVGGGMKEHAGMASKVYQSLVQNGIHVQLITSSEAKVSTVVAEAHIERGAQVLHAAFNLSSQ